MIKKITFVKPEVAFPVKKQGLAGDVGIPTGLLYLAGYIREYNGLEVTVADHRLQRTLGQNIDMEREFADSDIVGVGACTAEMPGAMNVFRKAKDMGKITVAGGLYPTFNSEVMLRSGVVDFVVFGEGESGLSNLVNSLNGKGSVLDVKGIAFKKNGEIVQNPGKELIADLDTIPLPAYDLVPVKEYAKLSPAPIYAARGCPMSCEFCTLNELWEYRYRRRSFDNILEELNLLKESGFKRVHFKDETITLNKKWCGELFEEISRAGLDMTYKAKSRVDGIRPDLLHKMMDAGLDTIHTGVESISQRTLDSMAKDVKAKEIKDSFEVMLGNGCKVNPVYMLGWPGERPEDLEENAAFIETIGQQQGVITYVSFITPHPGSSLESGRRDQLRILTTDLSRYTHKQPVAVPRSLGENGLQLMVDAYHRIAESCGMQEVNPGIDSKYLEQIASVEDVRGNINKCRSDSKIVHLTVSAA